MCLSPVLAVRYYQSDLGRSKLTFKIPFEADLNSLYQKYGRYNVFELPCGSCDECRADYAKNWAYRLTLESKYWLYGYFITLTYDDIHNPLAVVSDKVFSDAAGDLDDVKFVANGSYKDIQRFIKRCRYYLGDIAYFGASELGSNTSRLHYHLILFTNKAIDLKDGKVINNFTHYHSDFIGNNWVYGSIHDVCKFEHYCGAYVAKYTLKDKVKCFMSRNIGKRYFIEHYQEIVDDGFVIYEKFGKQDHIFAPRFMVQWFREIDDLSLDDFLKARGEKANFNRCENMRKMVVTIPDMVSIKANKKPVLVKKRGDF